MPIATEFRISNLGTLGPSAREALPASVFDGDDLLIRCPPGSGRNLSEQLIWLWALLRDKRRLLRRLQTQGATVTCRCSARQENIVLSHDAAQFLHLTGTTLILSTRGKSLDDADWSPT